MFRKILAITFIFACTSFAWILLGSTIMYRSSSPAETLRGKVANTWGSIFLLVSYLRLVVNARFALIEAGIAQFVFLVLFSYAFFFKGFTGLAITIGAIVTLFLIMQITAKVDWAEKFRPLPEKH